MTEEYRRNETEEMYENIWLFSRPALFSNGRVDRDTLPKGLYAYDLRGHDDDPGKPMSVENRVSVNHAGSVITAEPLPLPKSGFLLLGDDGLRFRGDEQTLKDFLAAVRRRACRVNKRKLTRAAAWVTHRREVRFSRNVRILSAILDQTKKVYSEQHLRALYRADEWSWVLSGDARKARAEGGHAEHRCLYSHAAVLRPVSDRSDEMLRSDWFSGIAVAL